MTENATELQHDLCINWKLTTPAPCATNARPHAAKCNICNTRVFALSLAPAVVSIPQPIAPAFPSCPVLLLAAIGCYTPTTPRANPAPPPIQKRIPDLDIQIPPHMMYIDIWTYISTYGGPPMSWRRTMNA